MLKCFHRVTCISYSNQCILYRRIKNTHTQNKGNLWRKCYKIKKKYSKKYLSVSTIKKQRHYFFALTVPLIKEHFGTSFWHLKLHNPPFPLSRALNYDWLTFKESTTFRFRFCSGVNSCCQQGTNCRWMMNAENFANNTWKNITFVRHLGWKRTLTHTHTYLHTHPGLHVRACISSPQWHKLPPHPHHPP
jgi:hypothetical protein